METAQKGHRRTVREVGLLQLAVGLQMIGRHGYAVWEHFNGACCLLSADWSAATPVRSAVKRRGDEPDVFQRHGASLCHRTSDSRP